MAEVVATRPHRMLWSYHYAKRVNLDDALGKMGHAPIIFADSGGYSALTQGAKIDVDEYAAWLLANIQRFEVYANLDTIGDPAATWRNQQLLEAKGLRPLPVFHYSPELKWLDRYADAGHVYIALGGLVGQSPEKLFPWLIQCFKWARARADAGKPVVFHGFGLTSVPILEALPWYSVDSTSWNSGARYANLKLFDPIVAAWRNMAMFDTKSVMGCAGLLALYGYKPDEFLSRQDYHFSRAVGLAARSWRAFEDHCRRRHGLIDHPHGAGAPGLHSYFANNRDSTNAVINAAVEGGPAPGVNIYLAATSRSDLGHANQALTPGLNIYLADGGELNHQHANVALTGDKP